MGNKNMKLLQTVLGVLGGNAILAFSVAAFIVPHGIIMGGATVLTDSGGQCVSLCMGDAGAGEEVCSDNDSQYLCLSGIFVCGTDDTRDYRADR